MKFRKKPVVIDAWQIKLNDPNVPNWADFGGRVQWRDAAGTMLEIVTLEGVMIGNAGDWLIKGVNGELYPCKPDIFEKTYEVAE